jgi:hypothetical protein
MTGGTRTAALAATAGIEIRRGRREAAMQDASPSTMPNGNGTSPPNMTTALVAVTRASTGSGQRRRARTGLHTTSTRSRRAPR